MIRKRNHLLVFALVLLCYHCLFAQKQPVEYVNPFIGTDGHGHTFPGATVPFGMVQLSPDTRTEGWDAASGYHYSDSKILGFSHTHLNGTGVNDLCDVLITPNDPQSLQFSHQNEVAQAGYYKTMIDNSGMTVELTASERVGFHRYHFADSIKNISFTIRFNKRNKVVHGDITQMDSTKMGGFYTSSAWANNRNLAFALEANLKINAFEKVKTAQTDWDENTVNISFDVSKTHELLLKVALSPVSVKNAFGNMAKEISHWEFDIIRREAAYKWSKYLDRIRITGGTEDQKTVFYTALYHTLTHPSVEQDVNGDYRGLDNNVYNSTKFTYHSIFSLWDTYRALHPLHTLVCPEKVPDFINGFIDDFDKKGHLPVWNFSGNETWCMIGNHSIPVITDAYIKGIRGFDAEKALQAMMKTVNRDTFGLKAYREKGYIPADTEGESVSKTLEYTYDDYCIAMMAKALRHDAIYEEYIKRSQNWKNLFNPQTGFFQAKINETFVEPFDPKEVNFNFTEGNAWQYAFSVQHDISGLIELMGGKTQFEAHLDSFFTTNSQTTGRTQVDITGLIGQYAQGNEPSHHIAYLYDYVGKPKKSQNLARQIMNDFYKNSPDGLIGNEDCGQMSAWYVLSAMGLYPINPCGVGTENIIDTMVFRYVDISDELIRLSNKQAIERRDAIWLTKSDTGISNKIVPIPFVSKGKKLFSQKQEIELECADKNANIYYTTDGSEPNVSGIKYEKPIEITESITLKFEARREDKHSKTALAQFKKRNREASIILKNPPAPQYLGGGSDALVDGELGTEQWQLGAWQGFEGIDLEAVIDLKAEKTLSHISMRCLEDQNAWIFLPTEIQFFTSNDGQNFKKIGVQKPESKPNTEGVSIRLFNIEQKTKARYVKIIAKPMNPIPNWHKGSGGKGWIFVDEILVD